LSTRSQFGLAARGIRLFALPNARRVGLTLVLSLAVAVASAYEPLLLKLVVDRLGANGLAGAHGGAARDALVAVIALFAVVLTGRILGAAWVTTSSCAVRLNMEYQVRSRVAAKLSVLSSRRHGEIGTGGLRYAVDESAPQTARAFSDIAFRLLPTLAYVAVAAWGMSRLDGAITAAVLCLAPIPALVAFAAKRVQAKRDRMLHGFWIRVWSGYTELLNGMGTVRAFAMERVEERRLMRRMRWAFSSIQRGVHIDARVTVAAGLAELAARVVVLTLGGLLVVRGELTVGSLLAFLGYVGGVFAPIQQIVDLYPTARKAGVALESVFAVLDAEEEAPDVPDAVPCPAIRGQIRFEHVHFGYRANQVALDDLDVTVEPGETVALVGPSGSGKSTVFRLLQRVHNPDAGRVMIDGRDLRALEIASVRHQFGVVPQDVVLFNDSVAANIAYGRPTAPREQVMAAAMAANAHEFIMKLPDGYDTKVGEGGRSLSGGQRQRLAIARAFLVNPSVLLFDEATAALDTESEEAVQEALRAFRRGRTTFIIAHRLNTVRDADRILVVSEGRIVGDGRHDALVESCAEYARLVRHQLGVEAAEDQETIAAASTRAAAAPQEPSRAEPPRVDERATAALVGSRSDRAA
jgi:ATP-binding cassette subfamily B protein